MRADSFLLGLMVGVAGTLAAMGLVQVLVTKGYSIAVELAEAGWSANEMKAHRKAAVILPFIEKMRADGRSQL